MEYRTSRSARSVGRTKGSVIRPDDLANDIATKLIISDTKVKGKTRAKDTSSCLTSEERRTNAMRATNTASKNLASLIEKEKPPKSWKAAENWILSARTSLKVLRELSPGDVDTERAASSIVGKLIALNMREQAIQFIEDMRPSLISLYCSNYDLSRRTPLSLLTLPLPTDTEPSEVVLTMIATFFLHTMTLHAQQPSNVAILDTAFNDRSLPTVLQWVPHLTRLPQKQHDALFTRAYTTLVKAPCPPSYLPKQKLQLKKHALICLAHTRPGVIVPDTFWEQAVKWIYAYSEESGDMEDTIENVLHTVEELMTHVEARDDKELFIQGRGFMRFCECWSGWAKQAGALKTLDNILVLMRSVVDLASNRPVNPQQSSVPLTNCSREERAEQSILEAATACTALSQAAALVEHWPACGDEDGLSRLQVAITSIKSTQAIFCSSPLDDDDGHLRSARDKARRALERLRRTLAKALESPSSESKSTTSLPRHYARKLLEEIADVLVAATQWDQSNINTNIMTSALDTLLVLARTGIVVRDVQTYAESWELLDRAKALLLVHRPASTAIFMDANTCEGSGAAVREEMEDVSASRLSLANYTRCVAGAFHNVAGTLYSADRISHAVRFLNQGCELGREALSIYHEYRRTSEKREHDAKDTDSWRQLEEQLWRRWEVLGICQAKTGDRKLAYDAFVESIKAFPNSQGSFEPLFQTSTVALVFEESPSLKQLGAILERVTYMGTCDFFLEPSSISVKTWLEGGGPLARTSSDIANKCMVGAMLERQIMGLVASRWKQGVYNVIRQLLSDALDVYDAQDMPIRRARVLLGILEMECDGSQRENSVSEIHELGKQVETLLTRENLGLDPGLQRYATEYQIKLHLMLALGSHRAARLGARSFPEIVEHAQEACKLLRRLLPQDSRQSSIGQNLGTSGLRLKPVQESSSVTRKATNRLQSKPRSGLPRARPNNKLMKAPVTPKARKTLRDISLNVAPAAPVESEKIPHDIAVVFDDFAKLVGLFMMTSQLLGLLGHALIKIRLLTTVRRLTAHHLGTSSTEHLTISIDLAHEYAKIGKVGKAANIHAQTLNAIHNVEAASEIRAMFLLRYAESLAAAGQVSEGCVAYMEAVALSDTLTSDEKGGNTAHRVKRRAAFLERAAVASQSFSAIQHARDKPSASFDGLLQSLRLWNRAMDTLSRLCAPVPSTKDNEDADNPFVSEDRSDQHDTSDHRYVAGNHLMSPSSLQRKVPMDALEWRIAEGLLETLFTLSQAYYARGSPREAEYFAQQACDLAKSLNMPATVSRAMARKGETLLHLGQLQDGHKLLMEAADFITDVLGTEAADICRLRADYRQRTSDHQGAQELYEQALSMLDELSKTFSAMDGLSNSPRKSSGTSPRLSLSRATGDALAPAVLAAILRQHISLLREAGKEYQPLLDRLTSLPSSSATKGEKSLLMAKLTLDDVYSQLRTDMFLNSLAESAITIPMGITSTKHSALSPTAQEILNLLSTAENSLWTDLATIIHRGNVTHVRDTALALALIRTLSTSFSVADEATPFLVARLIDTSTAITLRREMEEAIAHKFPDRSSSSDVRWPLITTDGQPKPHTKNGARTGSDPFDDSDVESDDNVTAAPIKEYWDLVQKRYTSQASSLAELSTLQNLSMPSNWTILNISITDDKNTIFITRQRAQSRPLVFCLPLRGRTENEDDEHLTYQDAMDELHGIMRLNDEGTRQAASVRKDDKAARAAWWAERSALDKRLQDFLLNIEFCWLGAFKTILSAPTNISAKDISALRSRIDKIFTANLLRREKKQSSHVRLDDALLECICALPPECREEELEDLVYFILDLYQFHGVSVATAEIDVDQLVVDLRGILEEHAARTKGRATMVHDSHTFLVLDKNVQGIPWESLPMLRGQSVSRIPNVDFLMDRMELARRQSKSSGEANAESGTYPNDNVVADRIVLNPRKTYYVLNPSGDLKGTEGRFANWLKNMKTVGWKGIVGRIPSEQQLADALERNDLMIYFGHGGAEQYIRSTKIRHLPRCAAAMLWGCSSGTLREMGDFDRVGTPYNYMIAGCPTLVANLWDVTDRDIDKFSQAVFDDLRLTPEGIVAAESAKNIHRDGTSVVTAVARARECCKLKYLTGAAPVVYGIPFYL